ncbi:MAG: serine protease HtrA, partial [Oscillospiraceae bacterium]
LVVSAAAGFGGGYLAAGSALSNAQRSAATPSAAPSSSPAASAVPTHTASGDAMSVSQVVRAVSGSVVAIETEVSQENFFFGPPVTGQGAGSGVILSDDGYVITNN